MGKARLLRAGLDQNKPNFLDPGSPPNITGILHRDMRSIRPSWIHSPAITAWRRATMAALAPGHRSRRHFRLGVVVERQRKTGNRSPLPHPQGFMQKSVLEWKGILQARFWKQMRRLGDSVDWERTYFDG